jgi:hypothetical protein
MSQLYFTNIVSTANYILYKIPTSVDDNSIFLNPFSVKKFKLCQFLELCLNFVEGKIQPHLTCMSQGQ